MFQQRAGFYDHKTRDYNLSETTTPTGQITGSVAGKSNRRLGRTNIASKLIEKKTKTPTSLRNGVLSTNVYTARVRPLGERRHLYVPNEITGFYWISVGEWKTYESKSSVSGKTSSR